MNVDQKEIDKFASLANQWWDEEGDMKPLHQINPLRMHFIKQQYGSLENATIADVGCGAGILTESLAKAGAKVTGIDLADESIEVAKLHLLESELDVHYECISVEAHAQAHQNHYDVITCMEMLEHVPDPESIIASCVHMLKPGGYLFLSTLNRNLKSYLMAIVGAEYILNLLPKGTHQYDRFIKPSEITQTLEQLNCDPIATTGIHYNPLTKSYKLDSNIDVNYIICSKKI